MLVIPCAIENISTRRDKTLKVTIGTQELTPEKATALMTQWTNGYGLMAFKGSEFMNDEMEILTSIKLDAEEMGNKTPSQRLRAALYVLYEKNSEGYQDFSSFYVSAMERMINMVKKRIETYEL